MSDPAPRPSRHHIWRITRRALSKSWDDSIFSESAEAAFWSVLSLPPLLLALLGSLAYVAPLFGPDTLLAIEERLVSIAHSLFSPSVVNEIIKPTIVDIDKGARSEAVSLGFVISLWAGSSAISSYVDAVVEAHDQTPLRHPVRQRLFALLMYIVLLLFLITTAPLVAVGPRKVAEFLPDSLDHLLRFGYYLVLAAALMIAVTILYRVALPKPLPWRRLILGSVLATVVFLTATRGLRIYLVWITSTGYTYGALTTPIAFLLFAFFAGFAIMLGAELNAALQEEWPAPPARTPPLRNRRKSRTGAGNGGAAVTVRATAPAQGTADEASPS
jgi:membrane protein